jgi:preprotein translocase subunit SecF
MEWIKPDVNINFMRAVKWAGPASAIGVLISIILIFEPGPKYGIDFSGGTEIQFSLQQPLPIGDLRAMVERAGFSSTDLVRIGEGFKTYRIRLQAEVAFSEPQVKKITGTLKKSFQAPGIEYVKFSPGGEKITIKASGEIDPGAVEELLAKQGLQLRERGTAPEKKPGGEEEGKVVGEFTERCLDPVCKIGRMQDYLYEAHLAGISGSFLKSLDRQFKGKNKAIVEEIEWVGPRVGKQFRNAGIKSLLYAWGLILIYTAFRFDLRFAPGAVICLMHDVLITIGIFIILRREIVLATVAAMLTIVGYSINDTIVIYDRIRENLSKIKERELKLVINKSVNETLGRTVMTSLTTIFSIQPILFLTRGTIQDFALALTLGVVIGTYSTVYIAAPISIFIDRFFYQRKARR